MFEDIDALSKVRAKALSLAFLDKWTIVNSNHSATEVAATIMKIIG